VLALARRLDEAKVTGIVECVPTFRSLLIHYEPLVIPHAALAARIGKLMQGLRPADAGGRRWRLPVCYDETVAPDLADVAAQTNLTPAQVVERHSGVAHHVYMLGFLPGQPYLGDLPSELALPRRPSPRMKIAAGSVAIATTLTCIFPMETPCGWHLIGRCPVPLWDQAMGPLLQSGDTVSFDPVSLREYEDMLAHVAASRPAAAVPFVREAAA
jgi:KipI family sensor histidine kinase inhibitor